MKKVGSIVFKWGKDFNFLLKIEICVWSCSHDKKDHTCLIDKSSEPRLFATRCMHIKELGRITASTNSLTIA